jgi:serine phosphatase RsbU (regulator of sigma subunit)
MTDGRLPSAESGDEHQKDAVDDGMGGLSAPIEEIAQVLALHPIFAQFDEPSLLAVAARCGFATFRAGQTIMRQGEEGTFACLIFEGEADVYIEIPPPAGRIHMATVGRHRIVGELGAFTDEPRTATVIARTYLVVIRIERDSLMSLSAQYPLIASTIIAELGRRLHSMNRPLAYLTYAATALEHDEYDPTLLAELAGEPGELAGFTNVFARMATEIQQKQRRRQEMEAAAAMQKSILPGPLDRVGPAAIVDLYAEMHPAREIGGDFYDYFLIGEDRLAVTVADVSGKGIPAALFMAVSRTVLRHVAGQDDMGRRMVEANSLLAGENEACMFVTLFHGVLELATGRLAYCNAGHNPPYLLRAGGDPAAEPETLPATGVAFGISPDLPYRIGETRLAAGDTLLLFTDGITEAFNPDNEEFGDPRLAEALTQARGGEAREIVARVLAETTRFAAGAEQSDDITCLALVYRPSNAPAP